jgi:hypothetical protein
MSSEDIVNTLNELLSLDPKAISELVELRAYCNNDLADHNTCQVLEDPLSHNMMVGLLGVINAISGKIDGKKIAAEIDEEGNVHKFVILG